MEQNLKKFSGYVRAILFIGFLSLLMNCKDDKPLLFEPCKDQLLGIYSETAPDRIIPDVDSFIGIINGPKENPGIISGFVDDNIEKIEGGISKRATVTVNGSQGQWAGWFVQWGIRETPETVNRDMSAFEGGMLTFWVKTTVNLEVGIRSANVVAGTERSKVYLNNYPPFTPNGVWQKVSIPLSHFTGSPPKADLKQIKILFVVASNTPSGGTDGKPATFWIDDIRWEKICPKQ